MRIRVVLDTATIRALIHGDVGAEPLSQLDPYLSGLSVAIANNSVPELVVALHQGRLNWGDWGSRVHLLDRILDAGSLIFPDDLEFQRIATGPVSAKRLQLSRAEHGREIWKLLREARKPSDLERGPQFTGSDGVEYRIESSRALAERLTEEHRARWIQMVEAVQSQIIGYHPTQEHIAELHFVGLFGGQADEAMLRNPRQELERSTAQGVRRRLLELSQLLGDQNL